MGRPGRSSSRSSPARSSTSTSHSTNAHSSGPMKPVPASVPASAVSTPVSGGGFFSNVLQTATGVAIGHTMGHALTGLLGGGGNSHHPSSTIDPNMQAATNTNASTQSSALCEPHLKSFMDCMERQHQDVSACQFYLDMLKQCRTGSSDYTSTNSTQSAAW